ncbi:Uncharacterized protein TCM_012439 [Theobroma cacao]|uniref:Uncharacterized protein n=1 Tax=Theobroma cacao TaxID=3641 RepID=A0A061FUB7_THECC|nr:Uncharacterized protein TCM_012439 [Theobroma cacao]
MLIRKMESKFSLRDKEKVKNLDRKHNHPKASSGAYCSSCGSSKEHNSRCHESLIEFACSACFFCIFCPLSIVWCCAQMPCKIGWRTARYAINWACCGSDKRVFVEYSSFSDIDLDDLPSKSPNNSSYPFNSARSRTSHRTNDSRQIPPKGQYLTWTNDKDGLDLVWKILDRAFANPFMDQEAVALLERPFEAKEVKAGAFQIRPMKAPGIEAKPSHMRKDLNKTLITLNP